MGFIQFEKENAEESWCNGFNICKRMLQRERSLVFLCQEKGLEMKVYLARY